MTVRGWLERCALATLGKELLREEWVSRVATREKQRREFAHALRKEERGPRLGKVEPEGHGDREIAPHSLFPGASS